MTTSAGFSGDLNIISLQTVLQFLAYHRETGRLTMRTDDDEITVVFERGTINSVSANDCGLLIGRLLVDQGLVTEDRIEQALALQAVTDNPARIGDVLVEIGHASREEIDQAVASQIEAALFRVLIQSGGTFEYLPDRSRASRSYKGGLELEPLVLNATYLADTWLADQGPLEIDTLPEGLIDSTTLERLPDPEREMLVELLDGYNSLHALAWRTGLSAKLFKDAVERLLQRALVRAAIVQQRNEQLTGRPDSSYEVVIVTDEVIDSWILDKLSESASAVLLEILNGQRRMLPLARQVGLPAILFSGAIDELVEQKLISILRADDTTVLDEEPAEVVDISLALADEPISASILQELSKSERRTLIQVLNGRKSLHQMSRETGLPAILFKEGADQLVERGLLNTDMPPDLEDPDMMETPG